MMARYALVESFEPIAALIAKIELQDCPRAGEFVIVSAEGGSVTYAVVGVLHFAGADTRIVAKAVKRPGGF